MNPLAAIQARAAPLGLRFVLAGGHAVIAHGYARNTFDLDLIIPRGLNVQDPAIRGLFLTYGTDEFYEKISPVCRET